MNALHLFHYTEINNNSSQAIFLLHGTGGTERDLLPLVQPFHTSHTIVGLRGNIREHGMARFFKRKSEGVFDQESISVESEKLSQFITEWSKEHSVPTASITFIGYSNGANMILATMFYYHELIKKAALLHPMLPFHPKNLLDFSSHTILLSWSKLDHIVPSDISIETINVLNNNSANLTVIETDTGHRIHSSEVKTLQTFI